MSEATHAYVTRCECGAINGACVDDPENPKITARETAKWMRQGRPVERVTIEDVRAAKWCSGGCKRTAEPQGVLFA